MTATACQLVVDVAGYRFDDSDGGASDAGASELEPPPAPGAPGDRPSGDDAVPQGSPTPPIDAGSNPTSEAPLEETPEPLPPEPSSPEPSPTEPRPESSTPDPPEPSTPEPEPLPPDPVNGCSIIEYCYAHQVQDTTDEERCIQRGCALDDAIAECQSEIADTCGIAPAPPFVMITVSGERVILN
jgi:hypothetical protein